MDVTRNLKNVRTVVYFRIFPPERRKKQIRIPIGKMNEREQIFNCHFQQSKKVMIMIITPSHISAKRLEKIFNVDCMSVILNSIFPLSILILKFT